MIPQQITPRQPMPVEEYGRSITQVPSELAMPQSTGPLPVVGSGGVVGLRAESAYSNEARELAAAMDKNVSIELMLMQIEYHQRQIEISNRWIHGCLCHLNQTVLPRWAESTMKRQPEPNIGSQTQPPTTNQP